jgi:hypothetical protein
MRPIRLHIDTSDYGAMYCAPPETRLAVLRDQLKEMARRGQVEIGISYHVIFELLQKAEATHREDRLARARLAKELCGQNAFPYVGDLGKGHTFSREGLWVPHIAFNDFEVERLVQEVMEIIARHPELPRRERRILSKRRNFVSWVRSEPTRLKLLPGEDWPLPFGRDFFESGDFRRYLLGEISRREANARLWRLVTDPVSLYKTWFEHYGRENPLAAMGERLAGDLILMLEKLQGLLDGEAALRVRTKEALAATGDDGLSQEGREMVLKLSHELKVFRGEITSGDELCKRAPKLKDYLGEKSARIAAQILYAFHRERRRFKRSDAIDLLHAMYLPHTDLWRGDKAFSDILIKHKVDFSDRVVPKLAELPRRIELEIAKQQPWKAAS